MWKAVLHPKMKDSLAEVRTWRFNDLIQAHIAMDALDEIEERNKES